MNEILFLIFVIALILFIAVDYVRFGVQVYEFINTAEELTIMYEYGTKILDAGDMDFEFHSPKFHIFVKEGDYKTFVEQTRLAVCVVQEKYNQINSRYFMEMDDQLASEIEILYQDVQNIQNAIRIINWQNGWK